MASPVAPILGAGANVGRTAGRAFAAKGYRVAFAAWSLTDEKTTPSQLHIQSDFAEPDSIPEIFLKVKSEFGPPSVVVYNASAAAPQDANNPLGLAREDFTKNFTINTTRALVAAQQALLAFDKLPESALRTFIYTSNCTNVSPIVRPMDGGVGKSASAHTIQCAAQAYQEKGYK